VSATNCRYSATFGRPQPRLDFLVWLNPEPEDRWHWTPSIKLTREIIGERMFPLTLDGLDRAMRELRHDELEQLILATLARATAQATEQVADLMTQLSPMSSSAAAFVRSGDYNDLLRRTDELAGYRPDEHRT